MKLSRFKSLATGLMLIAMFAGIVVFSIPQKSRAQVCATPPCLVSVSAAVGTAVGLIQSHILSEITGTQVWMTTVLWGQNILPALMRMAEQLTAVSMKQVEIFGMFMDAKHQLETQQVFQRMTAQMHKDYHPSVGMCEFGSGAKSLASSERRGEVNAVLMAARSQDRNLGNANTAAATGGGDDKLSRLKQFREKFCDPRDNNDGLSMMCDHDQNITTVGTVGAPAPNGVGAPNVWPATTPPTPPVPGTPPKPHPYERMNKDIDFVRTMDAPWTLDVDFTDTRLTENEEEVIALASNLYANEIFYRASPEKLDFKFTGVATEYQMKYMDARALLAKRSVAENSFNALTALKSAGTPGSRDYLYEMIKQLASPALSSPPTQPELQKQQQQLDELKGLLGMNPSYYAQMEVLTKKIYQNPDFFTNLYDKPVNVERKAVAMQAIGLMQKFDLYKSYLRNEASLSVLLELAVNELQEEIENEFPDKK